MSDLKQRFEQAAVDVQQLPEKPDNNILLKLYSLFKQGNLGDVTGEKPGLGDFKGAAKYNAWSQLKGMSQEQAMQDYIALVVSLKD